MRPVLTLLSWRALGSIPAMAASIPIVCHPDAGTPERWAAFELSAFLKELYPGDSFPVVDSQPETSSCILLSSDSRHPLVKKHVPAGKMDEEAEFVVRHIRIGNQDVGIIAGNSPQAVRDGVYSHLEQKPGHGFYLHRNAAEGTGSEMISHDGGPTRGEMGILIQHNLKWLNLRTEDQKATDAN